MLDSIKITKFQIDWYEEGIWKKKEVRKRKQRSDYFRAIHKPFILSFITFNNFSMSLDKTT